MGSIVRSNDEAGEKAVHSMTALAELRRSGHVLGMSVLAYVELSGAATHIPALIMVDVTSSLGISVFAFSASRGLGDLLKGLLAISVIGPALDRYGARACALVSMCFVALLSAALALSPSGAAFCVALVVLAVATSLCEQPTLVCINASHFDALESVSITCVSSAFSIAGTVLSLAVSLHVLIPTCDHSLHRP